MSAVVSFFLSVAKDLASRLTDMVLLYSEAFYRSGNFVLYFGEGYLHPPNLKGR